MGYKSLVDSNITLAFNLLKDMAEDAVLNKSSSAEFDFGVGLMKTDNALKNLPIKAVVIDDDKTSKEHNSIKRQILFKTRGLGDINAYDTITIDGNLWRFGPKINDDGYTILAEIYREV